MDLRRWGRVVHLGKLPQYVSELVQAVLDWTRDSDVHMLIKSCVSRATANRILAGLTAERKLVKCHVAGHRAYRSSE